MEIKELLQLIGEHVVVIAMLKQQIAELERKLAEAEKGKE